MPSHLPAIIMASHQVSIRHQQRRRYMAQRFPAPTVNGQRFPNTTPACAGWNKWLPNLDSVANTTSRWHCPKLISEFRRVLKWTGRGTPEHFFERAMRLDICRTCLNIVGKNERGRANTCKASKTKLVATALQPEAFPIVACNR